MNAFVDGSQGENASCSSFLWADNKDRAIKSQEMQRKGDRAM
jgi:hypothetical protein